MASLNINDDIYRRLARKAAAQKTTIEQFIQPALDRLADVEPSADDRRKAFDEWMSLIHKRSARHPVGFTVDDSRERIYEGRGE